LRPPGQTSPDRILFKRSGARLRCRPCGPAGHGVSARVGRPARSRPLGAKPALVQTRRQGGLTPSPARSVVAGSWSANDAVFSSGRGRPRPPRTRRSRATPPRGALTARQCEMEGDRAAAAVGRRTHSTRDLMAPLRGRRDVLTAKAAARRGPAGAAWKTPRSTRAYTNNTPYFPLPARNEPSSGSPSDARALQPTGKGDGRLTGGDATSQGVFPTRACAARSSPGALRRGDQRQTVPPAIHARDGAGMLPAHKQAPDAQEWRARRRLSELRAPAPTAAPGPRFKALPSDMSERHHRPSSGWYPQTNGLGQWWDGKLRPGSGLRRQGQLSVAVVHRTRCGSHATH